MTPQLALATILAIGSSAIAQHVTSPQGFLDREANYNTTFNVGCYSDGRFQQADGTHIGTPMIIKGTSMRHSNYIYAAGHGEGRSWANVQIQAAECVPANFTTAYSTNFTTTPTLVFSSSVNWPDQVGKPATLPAAWAMHFPFTGNWSYTGTNDILLDYTFSGGTLMNNATWGSTTSKPYYLDAQNNPTYVTVSSGRYGNYGSYGGCNDRGVAHVYGAELWSSLTSYGQDYPTASLRGTIAFTQSGRYFPGNRPMTTVVGFRLVPRGFYFAGITCNKVYIDLNLPIFNIPSFTNSGGSLVTMNLSATHPGTMDAELVTQVLWTDSVNSSPLLSNAAGLVIPDEPIAQPVKMIYHYNSASATGWMTASRSYIQVVRYTR